ncbi:MAG: hypothetical protein H0V25_09790 [Solirubrobacterales bacterium]|nr:hypothetical protein [Solirubrobacterales bacterium]
MTIAPPRSVTSREPVVADVWADGRQNLESALAEMRANERAARLLAGGKVRYECTTNSTGERRLRVLYPLAETSEDFVRSTGGEPAHQRVRLPTRMDSVRTEVFWVVLLDASEAGIHTAGHRGLTDATAP